MSKSGICNHFGVVFFIVQNEIESDNCWGKKCNEKKVSGSAKNRRNFQ